jgi:site-specific recombinase XerD
VVVSRRWLLWRVSRLRNLSERTIKLYSVFLRSFEKKLSDGKGPLWLAEVTPELTRAYFTARMQQESIYQDHPCHPETQQRLSPHTIHREVRTLRAFGSWLAQQGLENPFRDLKLPKLPRPLVEVLDAEEIEKLFAVYNPDARFGARWQAMFAFALDTGVRVSELVGLQAADLEIERFRAKVWGKGDKERFVAFGNRTQHLLLRYDNLFRDRQCPEFFQTLEGAALTFGGMQTIIKHARDRSGVKRLHWHLLRHTFATHYLLNNGNVFELQELLGHTSLEMVRRYTHLAHHLAQGSVELRRRSPLDNLERRGLKLDRRPGANGPRGPAARPSAPDPGRGRATGAR